MSIATSSLLPDPPRRRNGEEILGRSVAKFLRFCLGEDTFWYHVPNGGQRHSRAAARLAGQGVKAGVPDICVIHRGKSYFIELKIDGGYLSAIQKQVHQALNRAGARVAVCRSAADVEHVLRAWGVPLLGRLT